MSRMLSASMAVTRQTCWAPASSAAELASDTEGVSCRAFLTQPGPSTSPLLCFIVRNRGAAKLYPRYSLYLDVGHKFLMAARRRKKSKASNYVMSLDEKARLMITGQESFQLLSKSAFLQS